MERITKMVELTSAEVEMVNKHKPEYLKGINLIKASYYEVHPCVISVFQVDNGSIIGIAENILGIGKCCDGCIAVKDFTDKINKGN